MNSAIDIYKYFMKYPLKAGVLRNFAKTTSDVSGYNALKAYADALGTPVLPEIEDYIFGDDDKLIGARIKDAKSFFMYIEAEEIGNAGRNEMNAPTFAFRFSLFVCHKLDERNNDFAAQSLIKDRCLYLLRQVVKQTEADDLLVCLNNRVLNNSYSFDPVAPFTNFQATGWILSFTHQFNILFD
jgi:hypothetical protein